MQPYGQPLATGTLLENRYRIITLLGEGGMSRVYLADAIRLGTRVAVKENLQTDPHSRAQFEREAQILARLSHPNLPRVTDHFTDAATGRQYLVMDYIEGEDLEQMIARVGRLPEATALAWVQQILYALEYLHSQTPPVVHRDIKPANIKITPQGKAVLVDFGIAKTHDPARGTLTGARAVTPGYAPPEQYGLRTDQRSDIYALGATLYTMLTGRIPPEAPLRASGDVLIPPRQLVPALSPHTEGALLRAVELQPTRRWQTASEFRAALTVPAVPPPPPISATIPTRQPNAPTALPWAWVVRSAGAMLVIGLVFAGIVTWLLQPTPTPVPTAAPRANARAANRCAAHAYASASQQHQRPSWQARRWCSCQQASSRWAVTFSTTKSRRTRSTLTRFGLTSTR
jgi:serine/threonine protein kinase